MYILIHIVLHYGLSQDIEYSSLFSTAGPCSSILYTTVCILEFSMSVMVSQSASLSSENSELT